MIAQAFHSILFPVDFSESSHSTAMHVRGLAEQTGASVVLLHVIPWLTGWYSSTELYPPIPGDPELRSVEEQGKTSLSLFKDRYFGGIKCDCDVRSGAVAETIVEESVDRGVDLIMMCTRGLGRDRPFLIGSTTAKVLHDASCAVWTSPHVGTLAAFHGYKHILCTVDQGEVPHGYPEEAARLASCFGSKLTFVTAVPKGVTSGEDQPGLAVDLGKSDIRQALGAVQCSFVTEPGPVGEVVMRIAERRRVDLILTNRGHLHHRFGRFRTHAYEIVLESPCPVLSVCMHAESEHPPTNSEAPMETVVTRQP